MKVSRAISATLLAVLAIVFIIGVVLLSNYEKQIEQRAVGQLRTMLMLRESVLRSHFESLRSEVLLWSSRPIVIDVLDTLQHAHQAQDTDTVVGIGSIQTQDISSAADSMGSETLDARVTRFARHHHYYDVFFVSTSGEVLYTMAKEADYGTNLITGPYAESGLGRLFRQLMASDDDIVAFEDFSLYSPSDNQPAAFLGAKVYRADTFIGIYAIQIPESSVNEIMQFSAGMGESGETYLVGKDGSMRSNSRFYDTSTVLKTKVSGATVAKAMAGEMGIEIVDDYRGIPVYSAYRPFEFEGIRWAALAEKDVAEVRQPIYSARLWLSAAFVVLCLVVLLLRTMLFRVVLPASMAAFLGLSFLHFESD